jgi:hypothetical protein
MAHYTSGDQADTPIMHILIGIAVLVARSTGAFGKARRDEGPRSRALSHRLVRCALGQG